MGWTTSHYLRIGCPPVRQWKQHAVAFLLADTAPAWRAGINKQEAVSRGRIKTEFLPTHRRPRPRRTQPRESTDSLDLPLSTVRPWAELR